MAALIFSSAKVGMRSSGAGWHPGGSWVIDARPVSSALVAMTVQYSLATCQLAFSTAAVVTVWAWM